MEKSFLRRTCIALEPGDIAGVPGVVIYIVVVPGRRGGPEGISGPVKNVIPESLCFKRSAAGNAVYSGLIAVERVMVNIT